MADGCFDACLRGFQNDQMQYKLKIPKEDEKLV